MRTFLHASLGALTSLLILAPGAGATFEGDNGLFAFVREGGDSISLQSPARKGLRTVPNTTGATRPAWSPDGKRLLFAAGSGVSVVDADGSSSEHFTLPSQPGQTVSAADVTWSPDGKQIAFTGTATDASGPEDEVKDTAVYTGALDGSGFTRVREGSDPSWAPSGKRIAFVDGARACSGISTMDPDGQRARVVTGRTTAQCRVFDQGGTEPDYSPDGRRIAYVRPTRKSGNASDQNFELFTIGATGRGDKQLTRTKDADEAAPAYSPDGKRIAFGSFGTRTSTVGLFYARASDGSGRKQFRKDTFFVSWQPR